MGELGCNNIFGVKIAFTKWINLKSQKQSNFNIPNWSRGAEEPLGD
jgi:hypothetical protein